MYPKKLAQTIYHICEDHKGIDPVILDVTKISDITRYYVIVSGSSNRHAHAIADHIEDELRKKKEKPWHVERDSDSTWVVLDYCDVIVHVFYAETRAYYNLERLWGDAPRLRV